MKNLILLVFSICISIYSSAQQTTIQFFPEQPTETDTVMVVIDCSYSGVNCDFGIVNTYYNLFENTINFFPEFCPNWQDSTLCEASDTLFLVPLNAGSYNVDVYVGMTGQCPVGNAYFPLDTVSQTLTVDFLDAVILTEEINKLVQLFPNPTKNEVLISLPKNQSFLLSVFNDIGQLVLNKKISNITTTLPLDHLSNGIYFFTFQEVETGKQVTKKLVIHK